MVNVGRMWDESLYRLYVSSNMFHPAWKSIHSFIQCQIKDDNRHAFASDTIGACKLWWLKAEKFVQPFFCFFCILSLVCLLFLFLVSWISSAPSSYPSSFCSYNLDRWWESSWLLLRLISISYVWIFFVIILQSILVLLNHSTFEVLTFEMTS